MMYCIATTESTLRFASIKWIGQCPTITWLERLDMHAVSFFGTKVEASQAARQLGLTSWRYVKA